MNINWKSVKVFFAYFMNCSSDQFEKKAEYYKSGNTTPEFAIAFEMYCSTFN